MLSQTLDKALRLLELVGGEAGVSLAGIAAKSGLPKPTCYRLLTALCEAGYLRRDETSLSYRLGARLIRLGHLAESQIDLRSLALPHLRQLRDQFSETAFLATRYGATVYFIAKVESEQALRPWTLLGEPVPLYSGASSKVLAAFMPENELLVGLPPEPFPVFTEETTCTVSALLAEFEEIRRSKVCVTLGERFAGVTAVATPVFDAQGRVNGALALGGPSSRIPEETVEAMTAGLLNASRELSREQGYSGAQLEVKREPNKDGRGSGARATAG